MASDNDILPPDPKPKTSRQVMIDMLKDTIGIDRGYYFTLRDLYLKPNEVLTAYLNGTRKYLSPFALMGISLTIYYLISGLLVDWDAVSSVVKYGAKIFTTWFDELVVGKSDGVGFQEVMVPYIDFMILLFSKYLLALVVAILLPFVTFLTFFTKHIGLKFYYHLAAYNYNYSLYFLAIDALILVSVINIWLFIPAYAAIVILSPGRSLKIYGDQKAALGRPLTYSIIGLFVFFCLIGSIVGVTWSLWF